MQDLVDRAVEGFANFRLHVLADVIPQFVHQASVFSIDDLTSTFAQGNHGGVDF